MYIYLIGTSHKYQLQPEENSIENGNNFEKILNNFISKHEIKLLAEEMSLEALEKRKGESLCLKVSKLNNIYHLYADPDISERKILGIQDRNEIVSSIMRKALDSTSSINTEIELKINSNPKIQIINRKREIEWLRRLKERHLTPVLFICGAYHVDSFKELIHEHGCKSEVLYPTGNPKILCKLWMNIFI